ncbi:hypothetical protein [Fluviicola taffensis]|uniref:hypothetical protein n=1 Tax=Fluviicola taffensis TaxID=191579 RepID=UPI00313847B0
MTTEDKYKNLDRVNFWVTNCDSKVSYLLTLQGIILTIIFASSYAGRLVVTLSYKLTFANFGCQSFFRFIEGVSLYTFLISIIISLYNAYSTLRARLDPKIFQERGLVTNSVLFFETIANRSFSDFQTDQQTTTNANSSTLDDDIDSQIFINSKICQLKFKHYNLTLKYCKLALIAGLIYLILTIKNGV